MAKRGMSIAVARAMGVIQAPLHQYEYTSTSEARSNESQVIQMPMVGQVRSYHAGGLSSKELFKRQKEHTECVQREFRL